MKKIAGMPEIAYKDSSSEASFVDVKKIFNTLWRGKWIIALFLLVTSAAGAYYAYRVAIPIYRATSVVMMNTREQSVTDLPSIMGNLSGNTTEINSEVEVLRSRVLIGRVVDDLNLIDDPEFNSSLSAVSIISKYKSRIKSALTGVRAPAPDQTSEEISRRLRDNVITSLLGHVQVRNVPLTLVFQLTVTSTSPRKAATIADMWAQLYLKDQVESKFEATREASGWLADRVADLQVKLEAAEEKAKNFSLSTALISPENLVAQELQLKDIRDRISATQSAADAARKRLSDMQMAETREEKAEASGDSQLVNLLSQIPANPGSSSTFDQRYATSLQRAQQDITSKDGQLITLRKSEDLLQSQVKRQGQDLITLQQFQREAEASRLLYEHFLTRLNETSAQQGIQQADSRVLSNSVAPTIPAEPRKARIVAMSGILGLVLGAALVLMKEASQKTFRTARDLELATSIPVLGQIPRLPAKKRQDAINYLADKPASAAAEALRNLRTSILLSSVDNQPQIIMTTSSLPGEGKTTLALALAQNFSSMGKQVLLIEGDIRRRVMNQYFSGSDRKGILSVLAQEITLQNAIIRDDRIGADILMGEKGSANAADVFSSESFSKLMGEVRELYDIVIIDSPPVLLVPDARIIAKSVDAVLFTVRWDSTTKTQVSEALNQFSNISQPISGLVLNQIDEARMKSYGYGGEYGAYAMYGKKYYDS